VPGRDQSGQVASLIVGRTEIGGRQPPLALAEHRLVTRSQIIDVTAGVPDIQVAEASQPAHGQPVMPRRRGDNLAAPGRPDSVDLAGDLQAGSQSLDVPFPRPRQRLVEIVDIEDQAPFR